MTTEELDRVIEELRNGGADDDAIIYAFTRLYLDEKVDFMQYDALVNYLGYHLDEAMSSMTDAKRRKHLKKQLGMK